MQHRRKIVREIGTAFAVLAIYLLTVLTPLHQSRASQLDFAKLGYATLDASWALCGAPDGADGSKTVATKCPVTGIGKHQAAPVLPVAFVFNPRRVEHVAHAAACSDCLPETAFRVAAPPRAPPVFA